MRQAILRKFWYRRERAIRLCLFASRIAHCLLCLVVVFLSQPCLLVDQMCHAVLARTIELRVDRFLPLGWLFLVFHDFFGL